MKNLMLWTLGLLIASACSNTAGPSGNTADLGGNTSITGTLANADGKYMTLEFSGAQGWAALDSLDLDANGNFALGVDVKETNFYRINISNLNYVPLILSPEEQVTITIDSNHKFDITGSAESVRLQTLSQIVFPIDSIKQVAQQAQMARNVDQLTQARAHYAVAQVRIMSKLAEFINEKPGSLASLAALQQMDPEQSFESYKKVNDGLLEEMPDSEYSKQLNAMVSGMAKLAVGAEAPDLSLPDREGNPMSLSSLKGKVVLVDFWASWCKPCRAENPNVVRMYNKYSNEGFEVFSVSLDGLPQQPDGKGSWLTAIQQDNLAWSSHVSDLQGWQSAVVPIYNVKSIPLTFLIDREGKIIGKNLRGIALEEKLSEIFGA